MIEILNEKFPKEVHFPLFIKGKHAGNPSFIIIYISGWSEQVKIITGLLVFEESYHLKFETFSQVKRAMFG